MARFDVNLTGVKDLRLDGLSQRKRLLAAQRAVNFTATRGRTQAAREIRRQVNLPASYVSPGQKRLHVSKKASRGSLEAQITARARNTSLARFAKGTPKVGRAGVVVSVQPGKARLIRRAFFLRLPQGNTLTDTKFNLGLAIRLRPGESIRNKRESRRVSKGLYLLYGPSVDQVFRARDETGVANDIAPQLAKRLETEFLRLLAL